VRDPKTGRWRPDSSYDIGDEVNAWSAQLRAASAKDFWKRDGDHSTPTTLTRFASAHGAAERGALLHASGYDAINLRRDTNVPEWRARSFAVLVGLESRDFF